MSTSRTEIGSSSTANGSGDLVVDIKAMFETSRQQSSIGGLTSVPNHLRKQDEQAFTPMLVSIGPIHRSNPKLQTMKKLKVLFCERFIKRGKIDLKNLVEIIRAREKEISSYYPETILSGITSNDFVTMIVVDGMFILEYFLRQSIKNLELDGKTLEWMLPFIKADLVLLENQLPFYVLEMLFKQATFPAEFELKPLKELAFDFFECYNFQKMVFGYFNAKIEHFTDVVRLFYLGAGILPERGPGKDKLSYSATQLHEAGVKFKVAGKGGRFLEIRFDLKSGVLEIPCITLNDENMRLIRNIIALEQSFYVRDAYVTDFFVILDFLINTSKDVDLLCDEEILVNYLGDSKAAASVVNSLNTNIIWAYMNPEYSDICKDLNAFYKRPWHKWKAILRHQYFSTPWRSTSTCAAIILLLLTFTQTICSLKSTK